MTKCVATKKGKKYKQDVQQRKVQEAKTSKIKQETQKEHNTFYSFILLSTTSPVWPKGMSGGAP